MAASALTARLTACSTPFPIVSSWPSSGLTGRGRITEEDVNVAMREIRLALLEADVNYKVVKDFVMRVKERAIGHDVIESINAGQMVVKIVHEELTAILGAGTAPSATTAHRRSSPWSGCRAPARPPRRPSWLAGSCARAGSRCSLLPTPTVRPRSTSSRRWGPQLEIPVYSAAQGTKVVDIASGAVAEAQSDRS